MDSGLRRNDEDMHVTVAYAHMSAASRFPHVALLHVALLTHTCATLTPAALRICVSAREA